MAFQRSMTAGRSAFGKLATIVDIEIQEIGTWLLCALMYGIEAIRLGNWLEHSPNLKSVIHTP